MRGVLYLEVKKYSNLKKVSFSFVDVSSIRGLTVVVGPNLLVTVNVTEEGVE